MGRLPCILLVMSFILVFPIHVQAGGSDPELSMIVPTFEGLDEDGDRIDDRIGDLDPDAIVEGRIGLNVHLYDTDEGGRDRAMRALRSIGADPVLLREGHLVNALYLDTDAGSAGSIAGIELPPSVRFIELRPPVVRTLDISTKALRARSSDEHSPSTAQDLGVDGTGVNIAILDTGVDNTFHETFDGRAEYGIDFTGPTIVYGADPDDVDGHGTHVAGIAMGDGGNVGTFAGVAPGSGLVDLRIARIWGDTSGNLDSAMEWIIENHDQYNVGVVSISFGSTVNSPGTDTSSTIANALVAEGVVVLVAAGNNGVQGLPSPAAADSVITVASSEDQGTVDRTDDAWASYSNYGPRDTDGDQVSDDELKPDVLAPGTAIMSAEHNTLGAYVTKTGTSMACPHMAGVVALMLEANPYLTPNDVRSIIRKTAEQKAQPSYPGTDAKYNTMTGWGFADAYGAVKRAMDLRSLTLGSPAETPAGAMVGLRLSAEYTRTEWVQGSDPLVLSLTTPGTFGRPEGVTVSTGSTGSSYTVIGPRKDGDVWTVGARIQYNSSVEGAVPSIAAEVLAPDEVGVRGSISGTIEIGGVAGRTVARNVSIVENVSPADVSITPFSIWFSDSLPEGGQEIDVTVRVNNTQMGAADGCTVRVIDGPERTGEVIGERSVDIPGGGYALVTLVWEANPGVHAITAVADPENAIAESDETNNSAERPITVRGINPPPIARIESDTNRTTVLTEVTFDASSSSDTNVRGGNVVSYRFDFGDGTESGWINDSAAVHAYVDPGTYTASVDVRDNGGAQSVNDASVEVEITDLSSEEVRLYLDPSFVLVEDGVGTGELAFSGDDTSIGTWESAPFEVTTELLVKADLQLFIISSGANVSARAVLSDDSGTIGDANGGPVAVPDGGPTTLNISIPTMDASIEFDRRVFLRIIMSTDAEASLSMGKGLSSLIIYPRPVANTPPRAQAGADLEVKVGDQVLFQGSGNDTDGSIVSARWDVDGDGTWEVEGSGAAVYNYPGYASEGNFTASLEVRDDKGAWGRDTAQVVVWPSDHNFPPRLTMDLSTGANLSGEVEITGVSSDDGAVLRVELMAESTEGTAFPWSEASGTTEWTFIWNTLEVSDGEYTVSARAYDGEKYSEVARTKVAVYNPLHGPRITEFSVDPDQISLDGETSISFVLKVTDDDLPGDRISAVMDLSAIGGSSSVRPEEVSSSGTEVMFRYEFVPPQEIAGGKVVVGADVEDSSGLKASAQATVELVNVNSIGFESVPTTVRGGETIVIAVRVVGASQGYKVYANSTAFVTQASLYDDGKDPDRSRDDGVFTGRAMVLAKPGRHTVQVEVFGPDGDLIGRTSKEITVSASRNDGGAISPMFLMGIGAFVLAMVIAVLGVVVYLKASSPGSDKEAPSKGKAGSKKAVEAIEVT